MSRASKKELNKKVLTELQDNFSFLISSLSSAKDVQGFFEYFLTNEEKTMLTKRLMIYLMLYNNYNPKDIASILGLTRATVYIHNQAWDRRDQSYKLIVAKIARRKSLKQFWGELEKVLLPLDLALRARTDMRARAKLMMGTTLNPRSK